MNVRHFFEVAAAIVLPILFVLALSSQILHTLCFKHDGLHEHHVGVDLEFGVYTKKQIQEFESYVPPAGLGTKTPPPEGLNLGSMKDVLTIVVDFKEPGEPITMDAIGNTVGDFDVTSYGFSANDFDLVTDAIMAEVQEDFFDELLGTIANQNGSMLDINIIEGDIGTAPDGVSEYYFVQVGSGLEGPSVFALGVAFGSSVRNAGGTGPNGNIEVGDVVGSVFTDNIQGIGGLTPGDALTSGNLGFTTNAVVGTLSHEIGHTVSLSHINSENSAQPNPDAAPIMGTGAIDLQNQLRITDRQFSLSGFNDQNGGQPVFHISQLAMAIGLTNDVPTDPPKDVLAVDDFDNEQMFLSRMLNPDLSGNPIPGTFASSNLSVFGIVDRTVNENFADDTLIDPSLSGLLPSTVTDNFLAQADLLNPDNDGSATLQYTVDISEAENLDFSIDIAAMGNFENSDTSLIVATIDGGAPQLLVGVVPDVSIAQEYFFEDGSSQTLSDPMTANGIILINSFQTITVPIFGTGSVLTLDFTFSGNGPNEEVAFNNMRVRGDLMNAGLPGDVNCDGAIDLLDVAPFIDAVSNNVLDPKADINGDGSDNLLDVAPFVALVAGG